VNERYEFIDAEYATPDPVGPAPTVAQMCTWLGVSKSGFYDWRSRPTSVTEARRRVLAVKVKVLFERSHRTYGHRRIHAELVRGGERVGVELVRRLMREQDLYPCQPRPYKTTTTRAAQAEPVADLVRRDFTAATPGTTLVGDITYIQTWQGWLYLATVIDCFNREVIGYATAEHMRTDLVVDALQMAARNHRLEPGCVFHSDHGSQYTSGEFRATLKGLDMRPSLGRTGICFDNALAESFNGVLKTELVHRTVYPTRKKAAQDIARYIELFYNRRRLHSALGYRTPHEVRTAYLNQQAVA
jgi:transposase InsO family protein